MAADIADHIFSIEEISNLLGGSARIAAKENPDYESGLWPTLCCESSIGVLPWEKSLIMPTPSQPSGHAESERPSFGPQGPLSTTDIQTLNTGLDVIRALGRMEKAVEVLERTTNSHGGKIQETIRQVDKMDVAQSIVREGIVLQGDRIRRLEKVSHYAEFVGLILLAVGATLIAYLYHFYQLLAPLVPK